MPKQTKTNAMRMLDRAKIIYEIIEYGAGDDDFSDGLHVAQRLQEEPARVFKTLVTVCGSEHFVFLVSVNKELDLKKCARAAGKKHLDMLHVKDLTRVTGYIRGGCSPLGMKKQFPTFIDESVLELPVVYVSGGKRGVQIKIKPDELIRAVGMQAADISKEG